MSYNLLSASVTMPTTYNGDTAINLSNVSMSGNIAGDGTELINVNHTLQSNTGPGRIPFFDTSEAVGPLGNQFNSRGDRNFTFDRSNGIMTINGTASLSAITLNSASSELAVTTKYLALNANDEVVLTSSVTTGGPVSSLQFSTGPTALSGSPTMTFDSTNNLLALTGSIEVSGSITAHELNIVVINERKINLDISGSTIFGDSLDDTHQYTGSILVNGTVIRSRVSVTSSPFSIGATNYFVGVRSDTIGATSTINLPVANTLQNGQSLIIKDEGGSAQSHNIKITASAADLIDGQSEIYIESPFGSVNIYTDGSSKYFIY